jgi:hypothetical protein
MRNQLAIDVLDKNMLFLMKSYQATLQDPERLSSAISLLEHTSILTDIFLLFPFPNINVHKERNPAPEEFISSLVSRVIKFFDAM